MAEKAGLDAKNLTNYSGRKRIIQKLNDEGVWAQECTKSEQLQHSVRATTKNISNILSGYSGVLGPLGYQVGISSALSLNATKTVQKQPLTLFQFTSIQGGTLNISVNALNESPTLSWHSPSSEKVGHFVID